MWAGKPQPWPVNRRFARARLQGPFQVIDDKDRALQGWCRDISEKGMSGTLAVALSTGTRVRLSFTIPGGSGTLEMNALVQHICGLRYGFKFIEAPQTAIEEIREFVLRGTASAFVLSADPAIVREIQHRLQRMGMPHVIVGAPELPVSAPHLVVLDSEWPDFVEAIKLFRSQSTKARLAILALTSDDAQTRRAQACGVDFVLKKPIHPARSEPVLRQACNLVLSEIGDVPPGCSALHQSRYFR
jgi:CheY-like chemotaxis protein